MDSSSTCNTRSFDPARDGFGFPNPVGWIPNRTGRGSWLYRFDPLLYGRGLCFGMAAGSLLYFATNKQRPPLAELPPTLTLLDTLRKHHVRQYGPWAVLAAVGGWITSGGGRPEHVLERLRLVEASPDPHILCFGPRLNRRFVSCLAQAHAVVPYRVEDRQIYVYDPNYPKDRSRSIEFWLDGVQRSTEFAYDKFRSQDGWGITLVPGSALGAKAKAHCKIGFTGPA